MREQEQYLTNQAPEDIRRLQELANIILPDINSDDEEYYPDILNEDDEDEEEWESNLEEVGTIFSRLTLGLDALSLKLCTAQAEVVEMAHERTKKPLFSRDGRLPRNTSEELPRYYRTFKSDREKQLLRHVATQCYFHLQSYEVPDLVEIQAMHLVWHGKHSLLIAANQSSVTEKFSQLIGRGNFRQLLTRTYRPRRSIPETTVRSQRYAIKLENRIFGNEVSIEGDNPSDLENAKAIGRILRGNNIWLLPITYINNVLDIASKNLLRTSLLEEDRIYFVKTVGHSDKERHVEEVLCDIVDDLLSADKAGNLLEQGFLTVTSAAIAGKKRPCISCSARMSVTGISNYGQFPGRFWSHTIKHQAKDVQLETLRSLGEGTAYTTVYKDGSRGNEYDSGSDSEHEAVKNSL